jgi:DUF4097 and DUF4098 domain-containing protein YvlB
MKIRATKHLLGWSLAVVLTAPLAAVSAEEIDSTHEISADGLVQVENLAGSVAFRTWDRNEVRITGRVADDVEKVEIEATSNGLRVEVRNKRNQRRVDPTHLELMLPVGASIEAEGVSSDLMVEGSRGETILLNTVSGDVEVEAESNRVDMSTVSGDIEFEGSANRIDVESVSGDVSLEGISGEVEASTVSGDMSVKSDVVDRARFESVSGDIVVALELANDGRLTGDSMSGDFHLRLPANQEASFTAQSYSGNIRSDFGEVEKVSRGPGSTLKTRLGSNGARIRLESFSGDITIRRE